MGFQQGLSGLNSSAKSLEVIGNNVANSGTVGFKSATAQFSDVFASSLSGGGGSQVGIGAALATVAQQFTQGNVTATSNPLDIAINGAGMFRLSNNGIISYSRAGQFQLDKTGNIVTASGLHLTGYAADSAGQIIPGNIVDLQVSSNNIAPQVTTASQIQLNVDSRATTPAALTSGTLTGNVVLGATTAITAGSNDTLQLTVDGQAVSITIPPGSYTQGTLANTVQSLINSGLGTSGAAVEVSIDTSGQLLIKSSSAGTVGSQGVGSSVVLNGGTAVPLILSAATHATVVGNLATTLTFPLTVSAGATNNLLDITVDSVPLTNIDLSGVYGTLSDLATTIGNKINAALTAASSAAQVTVSAAPGNQLQIISNSTGPTSAIDLPSGSGSAGNIAGVALLGGPTVPVTGAVGPTSSSAGYLTASTVLGSTAAVVSGAVTGGVVIPATMVAGDVLTVDVDGVPTTVTITFPAATYSTLSALATAMTSLAVPANMITVTANGSQLKISSNSTGATSSIANITETITSATTPTLMGAAPVYSSPGGLGSIIISQGVNDHLSLTVDGVAVDVTIPAGTYTAAQLAGNPSAVPPVIGVIQDTINTALGTTGKKVLVSQNGSGQLVITSNASAGSGSTVKLVGGNAKTLLLGSLPIETDGTGPTWANGGDNFSPTNTTSYTSSTSQTVYDTLGNPHNLNLYFVKSSKGNQWQAYTTLDGAGQTGPIALQFSASGVLTTTMPLTQTYSLNNGASSPLTFTLDLTGTTQYGVTFGVNQLQQDGYTSGRLSAMSVSSDGTIQGRYSNGKSRNMGQLVLIKFNNSNGLQSLGGNQWAETAESGQPIPGTPGQGSLGVVQAAAVEESNVDLTAELVNMITQQRAYQANAQTIKTMDQILQTLVNLR